MNSCRAGELCLGNAFVVAGLLNCFVYVCHIDRSNITCLSYIVKGWAENLGIFLWVTFLKVSVCLRVEITVWRPKPQNPHFLYFLWISFYWVPVLREGGREKGR